MPRRKSLTGRKEKDKTNEARRNRRSNPEYLSAENARDNESRKERRSDPEYRSAQNSQFNEWRRSRRSDPEYRSAENSRDSESQRERRSDPEYSRAERSQSNESRRSRRSDPEYRSAENSQDNESRRKRRSDPEYLSAERSRDRMTINAWNNIAEKYENNIRDGPYHRCFSCDRLFFKTQISTMKRQKLEREGCSSEYIEELVIEELVNELEYVFCNTCKSYIKKKQFPRLNINHSNLKFPTIPQEFKNLNLTALEERCVAARIPFMRICALGCDRQLGIKSGVVNVPHDVRKTIDCIPARPEDSGVIELTWMRRMSYKNPYMKERVRPAVIWKAAEMLCETPLYRAEGITLNHQFEAEDNIENNPVQTIRMTQDDPVLVELEIEPQVEINALESLEDMDNSNIMSQSFEVNIENDPLRMTRNDRELESLEDIGFSSSMSQAFAVTGNIEDSPLVEERHMQIQVPVNELEGFEDMEYSSIMSQSYASEINIENESVQMYTLHNPVVVESEMNSQVLINASEGFEDMDISLTSQTFAAEANNENNSFIMETDNGYYTAAELQQMGISNFVVENVDEPLVDNVVVNEPPAVVPENDNYIEEETLLDPSEAIRFAPGEGEIPVPMYMDQHCEELAFPTIYFGHARGEQPAGVRLSYEDIVNSEILRFDRRACRADHLLFQHKKSQIKQLQNQINIVFRKGANNNQITCSDVINPTFIESSIRNDSAYKFSASITNTPAYWESQKRNVLAMIRQLGIFTLFITLSAAETHWVELLIILKQTVDKEEITDDDARALSFEEKSRLIRSDPVTCARYFDHRFKQIRKTWMTNEGPFGEYKVIHYFYRIEFQHRGSPHVHMVIWLKDAPIYIPNDDEANVRVTEFIDSLITTNTDDPEVKDLISYQYHNCTHTCFKRAAGKKICRFDAPFKPMDKTRILEPLEDELSCEQEQKLRDIKEKFKLVLDNESQSITSFENFLQKLDCTLDEYLLMIRANLKHDTIFIKRDPKECRINGYNKKILSLMRSNMDIQFVLDPYACIGYVVDYINKSARGLSRLLRQCIEDASHGNLSVKEKLKSVAQILYNSSEISCQEAAWCRCRLPMAYCSTVVEFINSGPSSTRLRFLKSNRELEKIIEKDPTSKDIYKKGMIERYAVRPDELENLCLAEFVAKFTFSKSKTQRDPDQTEVNVENQVEDENDEADEDIENEPQSRRSVNKRYQLKDKSGFITERKQSKVIRYCRFSKEKDSEKFYHEMCLLFLPWRKEDEEIENLDCSQLYFQKESIIRENYQKYNARDFEWEQLVEDIERNRREDEEEQINSETSDQNPEEDENFVNVFEFDDNVISPSFGMEIGEESISNVSVAKYVVPDMISNDEYLKRCDMLNTGQKDYLMHFISCLKNGNELPIHHFICGGAGVGKSRLIETMYQSAIRIFRSTPGPVTKTDVLLIAYTGMAAHNIGGMTAHAAFHLVTTKGDPSSNLKPDILNTMRTDLWDLKLIIIDEVSMLSAELLDQISQRLKQIFQSPLEFGGKSVIAVGDFSQLKPIGGSMVFQPKQNRNPNSLTQLVDGNPQWQLFKLYELTEIMRQKDDLSFAECLNRIAIGTMTTEDVHLLKSRCFTELTLPEEAEHATRIMATNKEVDEYNNSCIQKMKNQVDRENASGEIVKILHIAEDKFSGQIVSSQRNQAKNVLERLDKRDTQNLVTKLELVKGIRYMISTNVDVSDGLFNGASGLLKRIELLNHRVQAVYIEFEDTSIGKAARAKRKSLMEANKISNSWTPIMKVKKTFNVLKKGTVQVTREQFPLVPAEGITIHKSQGQSMTQVVVKLGQRRMVRSMLYVALSRATTLNGLYLLGDFKAPDPPKPNDAVIVEMNRMKSSAFLIPKFKFLRSPPTSQIQIISNNVQSLRKHINTITNDQIFMHSDIILLQETWCTNDDIFVIPGFIEITKNDSFGRRSAQGTIIFCKEEFANSIEKGESVMIREQNKHLEITSCIVSNNLLILNVYNSPNASFNQFKEGLNAYMNDFKNYQNILLFGDLNQNFSQINNYELYLNEKFNLTLISERKVTTDGNTVLDCIFSNTNQLDFECFCYESYHSYHKSLICRLNK